MIKQFSDKYTQIWKRIKRHRKQVLSMAVAVVVGGTALGLSLPATTVTAQFLCGQEEHTHSDDCYTEHTELTCAQEEYSEVVTTDEEGNETVETVQNHVHTEDCYTTERELTCGKEEHVHSEECYEKAGTLKSETSDQVTVELSYDAGEIHSDTSLSAKKLDEDAEEQYIAKAAKIVNSDPKDIVVSRGYKLTLNRSGVETQPDGEVEVTIQFDTAVAATSTDTEWGFFYIDRSGNVVELTDLSSVEIETDSSDAVKSISYEADNLGSYLLVGVENNTVDNTVDSEEKAEDSENKTVDEEDSVKDTAESNTDQTEDAKEIVVDDVISDSTSKNAVNANTGTDFHQYITEAIVQKLINNVWTSSTEFNDGDKVRVKLAYEIPAGILSANSEASRTIYYQLPDGITESETMSGRVIQTRTQKEIGSYIISKDGLVTIVFDEDYIVTYKDDDIDGEIHFEGTATNTSDAETKTIEFGGKSTSITVKKEIESTTDISTTKTSSLNADNTEISYTITTSTTKGTGETVKITDAFSALGSWDAYGYQSVTYNQNTLKIQKKDQYGNLTDVDRDSYSLNYASDGLSFAIEGLPALNPGESYITTYTAALQGAEDAFRVGNSASSNGKSDYSTVQVNKVVQKTGTFNSLTVLITWTVTVNPDKVDLTGWKFTDTVPYDLVGNITITGESTGELANFTNADSRNISYIFENLTEAQKKDKYTIVYTTEAPHSNTTATNKGTVEKPDGSKQTSESEVNIVHRVEDVVKHFVSEDASYRNELITYTWSAEVILPETPFTSFTYVDTIGDAVDPDTGESLGSDSHYTTAASLEEDFANKLFLLGQDETKYIYGGAGKSIYLDWDQSNTTKDVIINITYFDQDGNEVASGDNSTKVKRFEIHVEPADYVSIVEAELAIGTYRTYTDTSGLADGQKLRVFNSGSIVNHKTEKDHDTVVPTPPKKFTKKIETSKDVYQEGDVSLNYNDLNKTLTYRLTLVLDEEDTNIKVSDLLPEGTTYVDGSFYGRFCKETDPYLQTKNFASPAADFGDSDWVSDHVLVSTDKEGEQQRLTIAINDATYNAEYNVMVLTYQVSFAEDSTWENIIASEKKYVNTATWNTHTDTQETTVKREVETLSKEGKQLTDENGKPLGSLQYFVTINPKGEDLLENSDTLILVDTFNLNGGYDSSTGKTIAQGSKYNPSIDISSVKLYSIDSSKENNLGEEISKELYSYEYNTSTATLTVKVPDETPCILTYEYEVNMTFGDGTCFGNNAKLIGKYSTSSELEVKSESSGASADARSIAIYKVDSGNYGRALQGAEFKLYKWDSSSSGWTQVMNGSSEVFTTDENGRIKWHLHDSVIKEKVLYKLVESKAPDGYALGSEAKYFVYLDESDNVETAKKDSGAESGDWAIKQTDQSYSWESVRKFKHYGNNVLYVPNDSTEITVKKVWTDVNGVELTSHPDSVQVKLKQGVNVEDSYTVTFIHKGSQDWSGQFSGSYSVAMNGSMTISLTGYKGIFNDGVKIEYGGRQYDMEVSASGDSEMRATYTIDNVTGDMTVITTNQLAAGNRADDNNITITYTNPGSHIEDSKDYGEVITLDAGNNWFYKWSDLPALDESGNAISYTVEEVNVPKGYSVSYINNNGIHSGQITVNNQKGKDVGYELPHTGGSGSMKYILSGFALVSIALLLFSRRKPYGRRAM